jgi:hypothetical protein
MAVLHRIKGVFNFKLGLFFNGHVLSPFPLQFYVLTGDFLKGLFHLTQILRGVRSRTGLVGTHPGLHGQTHLGLQAPLVLGQTKRFHKLGSHNV